MKQQLTEEQQNKVVEKTVSDWERIAKEHGLTVENMLIRIVTGGRVKCNPSKN